MGDQQRQRGRGHAVDPAGLANGSGPNRFQLLPHFHRKRSHLAVVEAFGQLQPFVAPIGRDVGGLAVEIDRVFGVDLDLLRDRRSDLRRAAARSGRGRRQPMFG